MMHDKNKKENSCGKYKYLSTCEQPDEFDYFPFIMTQAPVKPLIHPFQFKIYADAYEKLKRSNCLIIIGYSLPNSDNHILTMIKTFLKQRGRKLIYFDYQKDLTNEPLDEKLKKKILVEYDKRKRKLLNDSLNKNLIDFEKEIILATETNIKSKIYEHFNNKDQQLIYIVYSDKCQIKFNNILDIIKNINLKDLKNKKELMITK